MPSEALPLTCCTRTCIFTRCSVWVRPSDARDREASLSPFLMPSSTSSSHPLCSLIPLLAGPPVRTMAPRPPEHSLSSYPPTNHKAFPSSHSLQAQPGLAGKVPEGSWAHRGAFPTQMPGPHPQVLIQRRPGVSPTWHPWPRAQAGHPQRSGFTAQLGFL